MYPCKGDVSELEASPFPVHLSGFFGHHIMPRGQAESYLNRGVGGGMCVVLWQVSKWRVFSKNSVHTSDGATWLDSAGSQSIRSASSVVPGVTVSAGGSLGQTGLVLSGRSLGRRGVWLLALLLLVKPEQNNTSVSYLEVLLCPGARVSNSSHSCLPSWW